MIEKNLHQNKIIFSISFLIIANFIFNHEFLFYFYKGEVDFSNFVDHWMLSQYICSYQLEFAKRCFVGSFFQFFKINVSFKIIYLFNLIVLNFLIILLVYLINKIESKKIILSLFSLILFSPFFINNFANSIGINEPQIYLFFVLIIFLNLKNKNELYLTLPLSVMAILTHEISLFIIFPIIFLIKFENCYKNNNFSNLILFSTISILTYLLVFIFGEISQENANIIYQQVIEIKEQNFNTALIFLTGIYDANHAYVKPTIIRNIINLNIPILFLYLFLNYLMAYKIFKNYFIFNQNLLSLIKLFILILMIFILYYFMVSFFDQICEFLFKRNPNGAPLLREIVLKLSFLLLLLTFFYITYLYGFKKLINNIYESFDFLLFLCPLIILLTFFVGSAYGRYVAFTLINLVILSIYFCIKFDHRKLNLKYFNIIIIFNFIIFLFFHINDEGFSSNFSKLPVTPLSFE